MGMKTATTTIGISMEVPHETKNRTPYDFALPLLDI
jgi:hypothetical protein